MAVKLQQIASIVALIQENTRPIKWTNDLMRKLIDVDITICPKLGQNLHNHNLNRPNLSFFHHTTIKGFKKELCDFSILSELSKIILR